MKAALVIAIALGAVTLGCSNDETLNPVTTSSSSGSGGGGGASGAGGGLPQPVSPFVIDPIVLVSGDDNQNHKNCRTEICRHNENTDLTVWKGATWLVHRTAQSQVLGPNSALHVYKSTDHGQTFTETARIPAVDNRDIRDPSFYEVGGKLFLKALTRLAVNSTRDSNVETIAMGTSSSDGKTWSKLVALAPKTWSYWRIKENAGVYYSAAYEDGDKSVVLFSSTDGLAWTMGAPIYTKSADTPLETELTFMSNGKLLALVRMDGNDNELLGNAGRLRTKICWADPPYDTFDCPAEFDGQRLDGPVSFFQDDRLFVIARRNIIGIDCKKRTALFEITGDFQHGGALALKDWGDLPSAGDTSYAGVAPIDSHTVLTTWYSGSLAKDESWVVGILRRHRHLEGDDLFHQAEIATPADLPDSAGAAYGRAHGRKAARSRLADGDRHLQDGEGGRAHLARRRRRDDRSQRLGAHPRALGGSPELHARTPHRAHGDRQDRRARAPSARRDRRRRLALRRRLRRGRRRPPAPEAVGRIRDQRCHPFVHSARALRALPEADGRAGHRAGREHRGGRLPGLADSSRERRAPRERALTTSLAPRRPVHRLLRDVAMQDTHTRDAFDALDLEMLDEAWIDELEPEPVTLRTRRVTGSLFVFGAVVAGAALVGSLARPGIFYRALRKPRFQPPRWLFAPVWSALYALIAVSGDRVYRAPASPERTTALALWGGQLALNAAWSPIFFGARRPRLALVDAGALLATIGAYLAVARNVDRSAARMFVPYGAWAGYATLLSAAIVKKNRWLELGA